MTELPPRERELLQLTGESKSIKGIARRLHVTAETIETHRANIIERLDVRSVAELAKYAIREGLTSVDT